MPPNAVVLLATRLCSHSTDACGCGDESSCLTVPIAVPSESHTSFSTFDLSLISPPEVRKGKKGGGEEETRKEGKGGEREEIQREEGERKKGKWDIKLGEEQIRARNVPVITGSLSLGTSRGLWIVTERAA